MFLTEFFNQPEGDSYAKSKTTTPTTEAKRMSSKKDPCWKGHTMVGTKNKSGKAVPNCVPVAEEVKGIDTVSVDVPLLIRLLEYAREDANTDMDLHNVAERAIALSQEGRTLTMDDYNEICNTKE